jgi:hypothetical protein
MPSRLRTPLAAAVLAAGLAFVATPPARADMVPVGDILRPGQSFQGDVPPGETMRIAVELAEGAKLRLRFTFTAPQSVQYLPANFQRVSVTGPDGKPVTFDTARDSIARYDSRRRTSTFQTNDWPAPTGGVFTFSIVHRTTVATQCVGRVQAIRPRKVKFEGSLGSLVQDRTYLVPVQPGDATKLTVRRVDGSAPYLAAYTAPGSQPYVPSQKQTKTGSTTRLWLYPAVFGSSSFTIASQDAGAPDGTFKGFVTLRPGGPYGKVGLAQRNPPGVPLSVQVLDASQEIGWASGPCGVGFDEANQYLLVTGEVGGQVEGKYYTVALEDPSVSAVRAVLVSASDFSAGAVAGHRLVSAGGFHYVTASNTSGSSVVVSRFPFNLVRSGFATVVDGAAVPANDHFVVTDGLTVYVGTPNGAFGHVVAGFDATTLASTGFSAPIGNSSQAQAPGAGAAYRPDQNVFELWAPTSASSQPTLPSDLSHGVYSPTWAALVWETSRVGTAVTETQSTSVVYDAETGATIVHYVEPTSDGTGFGILHRRLYDALGNELSHGTPLGTSARVRRPSACISGGFLYVAVEGVAINSAVRFRLLRD